MMWTVFGQFLVTTGWRAELDSGGIFGVKTEEVTTFNSFVAGGYSFGPEKRYFASVFSYSIISHRWWMRKANTGMSLQWLTNLHGNIANIPPPFFVKGLAICEVETSHYVGGQVMVTTPHAFCFTNRSACEESGLESLLYNPVSEKLRVKSPQFAKLLQRN